MGRHYFGDVIAGLLVGLVTSAAVTQVRDYMELCTLYISSFLPSNLYST